MGKLLQLLKQSVGRAFPTLLVSGEVLDPLISARGHLYFRLTDGQAEIRAVMWKRDVARLSRCPQAGDQVTVRGGLDIYAPRGDLQLQVAALMHSGRGQKMLQLAELKKRLRADGVFDAPRKTIPKYPKRLGVVTSVGSAVIHDIYQTVQKRFPFSQVILSPASIGGPNAAVEIIRALDRFGPNIDLVMICRGGGSFEELLPFSDEALVRKVAEYTKPIIAAVGHGSDTTLLDLVADHTAPTPTAAAVLATPDGEELRASLRGLAYRLGQATDNRVQEHRVSLQNLLARCQVNHPGKKVERQRERVLGLKAQACRALKIKGRSLRTELQQQTARLRRYEPGKRLNQAQEALAQLRSRLEREITRTLGDRTRELRETEKRRTASGPHTIRERGYAFVLSSTGAVVTSSQGRTPGEELELHLADGRLVVEVKRST